MAPERLLIVEDEKVLARSLSMELQDKGYHVDWVETGESALEKIDEYMPQAVLLDLRLPGIDGIQVLEKIRQWNEDVPVIIMTAYGDTQTTVDAIKQGAFNFINKPFELEEIKQLIRNALDSRNQKREYEFLRYQQRRFYRFCDLVGQSPQMLEVYRQIDVLSQTDDVTILIRGESGTGKELVAGALHYKSKRNKAPLMEINCASLPESLLESELFGYEKGAFTDAKQNKKGLLELADGGSIFLDEIGETPLTIQAKLLRFLEKKQFKRLGSGKDLKVDARIIAATNKDLEEAIKKGLFRSDLFYRLNVVTIQLPPLRERKEDIILLANHFLNEFCKDMGKPSLHLSNEVKAIFNNHNWPGNVRELRNLIERTVIFCQGSTVEAGILPAEFSQTTPIETNEPVFSPALNPGETIDESLARLEIQIIQEALQHTGGNKSQASQLLGISRFSLKRRLERLKC